MHPNENIPNFQDSRSGPKRSPNAEEQSEARQRSRLHAALTLPGGCSLVGTEVWPAWDQE